MTELLKQIYKMNHTTNRSFIPISSSIETIESLDLEIDDLLNKMKFVLGQEKTKEMFDEIQVGPEKFTNDEREIYQNIAKLILKKLHLTEKNLKVQHGEIDLVKCFLQKQEQRLMSHCKWLTKRFKYVYNELTLKGETVADMTMRLVELKADVCHNQVNHNHGNHIGYPIIFSRTPFMDMKSIGFRLNASEKKLFEEATGDLLDFMTKKQIELRPSLNFRTTNIISMLFEGSEVSPGNEESDKAFIRGNVDTNLLKNPTIEFFNDVPKYFPMIIGNLDPEYMLEIRIESLERIRNVLVLLNNLALYFTVPRKYPKLSAEKTIIGIPDFKLPSTLQQFK